MIVRRSSVACFFANRRLGKLSCLHASTASLVQVRAMSSRAMAREWLKMAQDELAQVWRIRE